MYKVHAAVCNLIFLSVISQKFKILTKRTFEENLIPCMPILAIGFFPMATVVVVVVVCLIKLLEKPPPFYRIDVVSKFH